MLSLSSNIFRFMLMVCFTLITLGGIITANSANLKMAYDADPVSLDPHEQLSGSMLQLSHMSFDPLIRWGKDLEFEPRLAKSWQWLDDTTLRFKLRRDVKFHSGNTLTAKDVVFTVKRLKQSADFKGIFSAVKQAVAVGKYTVVLKTDKPFPLLLNSSTYIFPMDSAFYTGKDANGNDKAAIVKNGASFASRHLSGTGPFMVTFRQQGVRVKFTRFGDYWDKKSKGNVKHITLTPIKEGPTRVAALLSGDVQFAAPISPTDHRRIKRSKKVDLITMPGTRIIMFQMNQKRFVPFQNKRVRQAIVYAVNNAAIVKKIMKGFGTTAAQFSPAGYLGHHKSLTPRYNLRKAKKLMKQAGYADGFKITMMAPNNRYVNDGKIAQAVASMLAKINIKVDLKTMPKAQYWPMLDKRAADMMMIGWHSDTEDSNNFYEFLTACPNKDTGMGQYNSGNYCNPKADKLMHATNAEIDSIKRAQMMQKIEKILYDDAAFIPLHWQNLAWGAAKNVKAKPILNVMNFPYLGDLVIQ